MKIWQKILSVLLIVASFVFAVLFFSQEKQECCLCNSFRYHAPCLVDLKTGNILELDLYFPHPAKSAELAEVQPQQDTFSFIHFGNVSGYKNTSQERIEITVPTTDTTANPILCKTCQNALPFGYNGRYVLADLYTKESRKCKEIIPIIEHIALDLRCYSISITLEQADVLTVIIKGNLA